MEGQLQKQVIIFVSFNIPVSFSEIFKK